jgi:protein-disulfide isomerase
MKKIATAVILFVLTLVIPNPTLAQSSNDILELKKDIEALKAGQDAIQKDLQSILEFFKARQAPQAAADPTPENPVTVSIEGGAIKGDRTAKITLVEFTDYQCPFCSRHFRDTMPQLVNEYVKTGKVRYVLRDLPLESIHPQAVKAAEAANCSGEQGKYWEMHERLFTNQNALAVAQLSDHAKAVGLELGKFNSCLESGKYTAKVRKDIADAQKAGATGTPTFFVGLTDGEATQIKAVKKIVGSQAYAVFKSTLDGLLAAQ